jgi:gas vesicle protein
MTIKDSQMRETDSVDLVTAFAIGAMIGVGATLLLRPDPPSAGEQIFKRFKPIAKRAKKAVYRVGRNYDRTVKQSRAASRELGSAGKDILDDLRDQVEEVLSSARHELSDSARKQLKTAQRALRRRLG